MGQRSLFSLFWHRKIAIIFTLCVGLSVLWVSQGIVPWLKGYCFEKERYLGIDELMTLTLEDFTSRRIYNPANSYSSGPRYIEHDYFLRQCDGDINNCCRLNYGLKGYVDGKPIPYTQEELRGIYAPGESFDVQFGEVFGVINVGCSLKNHNRTHKYAIASWVNPCGDQFNHWRLFEPIADP